jgi:phosphoesterase RecJ-like protein
MSAHPLGSLAAGVPEPVVERVAAARAILALGHENPDADSLGAALAIAMIVEQRGGRATVVASDGVPALYRFLPRVERVKADPEPGLAYDLVVLCDCGDMSRVGAIRERNRVLFDSVPVLTIDHHSSNGGFGDVAWIDPGAAATCEMVALLAARLDVPLDAAGGDLASLLAAGIVMDTATFAHPNATPRTLRVAAALVEAGAPLSEISRRLYRTKPDEQLALFGRVLGRLERHAEGLVVATTMDDADLAATGARPEHAEGIIDLLAQSETAAAALLLRQKGAQTRLSVRTKPGGIDAAQLCATWGGGGHPRAAGATLDLPLAEALAAVLPVVEPLARATVR